MKAWWLGTDSAYGSFSSKLCAAFYLRALTVLRLVVQAVRVNGRRRYDVDMRLASTNEVIVLVEQDFEDIEPKEVLRQACEAKAKRLGYIEELSIGLHWPSSFPLERERVQLRPSLQGESLC